MDIRDAINHAYHECDYCGCGYVSQAAADACCQDPTRPWGEWEAAN